MILIVDHHVDVSGVSDIREDRQEYQVLTGTFNVIFLNGSVVYPSAGIWEKRPLDDEPDASLRFLALDGSEFSEETLPFQVREYLKEVIENITKTDILMRLILRSIRKIR